MKIISSLLLLLTTMVYGQDQVILSGKVANAETGSPVPYANIGILNTGVGTISNEDGTFSINIPLLYADSNLLFSSVGYKRKSIDISYTANSTDLLVYLIEEPVTLGSVEVFAKKEKRKHVQFGNGKSLLLSGQLHYDTLSAGSAMALLIKNNDCEYLNFIREVSLYIAKSVAPEFKIRLRFLSVDTTTHLPDRDLVNQQLIEVSSIKRGWLDFKIDKNYQIKEREFFLVFEWIMDQDDRKYIAQQYAQYMKDYPDRITYDTVMIDNKKLSIPQVNTVVAGTVFGVTKSKHDLNNFQCYYRANSFGTWKRSTGILSAKMILSNYPLYQDVGN